MKTAARWRQLGVLLCGWLSLATARADPGVRTNAEPQKFVFIVNEENDKFLINSTDKHYTQGLHLSLLWPDDELPVFLKPLAWLPDAGVDDGIRKYGLATGQSIYTPENLRATTLIADDRPYAGWFYLGLIRETRGTSWRGVPTLDHFEVDLGVIGPDALAEESQNWFHDLIQANEAEGWRHQLHNEPAVLLLDERKWLLWDCGDEEALKVQLLPKLVLKLGNVETSAKAGAMMRLGYHIPDEFGRTFPERFGFYVFSEIDARGVLHNEFLDGNLISDSHSVKKEPGVAELHAGVAFVFRTVEFRYTYNYQTREFKLQDKYDAYGSLDFVCRF